MREVVEPLPKSWRRELAASELAQLVRERASEIGVDVDEVLQYLGRPCKPTTLPGFTLPISPALPTSPKPHAPAVCKIGMGKPVDCPTNGCAMQKLHAEYGMIVNKHF